MIQKSLVGLLVCLVVLIPRMCLADYDEWTWMSGDNETDQYGTYGTKGTADVDNIPSARNRSISWTDSNGIFWLFGGSGVDRPGSLNDLWRYDPDTNMWTWMSGHNDSQQQGIYGTKGTPNAANIPGARYSSISWTGSTGDLWLFGGSGIDGEGTGGVLNDLWRYNPDTNMWTWIKGDNKTDQVGTYGIKGTAGLNNIPGARVNSISWTDSNGDLWLFGGVGYGSSSLGNLNDLWRYDPDLNMWTWISGDDETDQRGIYGTKGTADLDNIPGARIHSISWTDSADNLWLFGGYKFESGGGSGQLNDLWRYDPATDLWTWMSGDNETFQEGTYGIKGRADLNNIPGARDQSISWTGSNGNLWLFGGEGYGSSRVSGYLNDLWRYDPDTNMWTWMSGHNGINQIGTYGTKGAADLDNIPGTRTHSISWTGSNGNLWLFGGYSYVDDGWRNDVWRYELPECMVDADCLDGTCEDGFCVDYECTDDDDCAGGICIENVCVDYECDNDQDCLDGTCEDSFCVDYECIDDADCTDGECVENVCIDYDCMDDTDCPDGVCTADHICVECEADLDCADHEICEANLCEDACQYPPEVKDFDLDVNCLLSKDELKAAKTFYKDKHKGLKDALKVIQTDDKAFLKSQKDLLSKDDLKAAKTFYKDKHKGLKDALKVIQTEDKAFLKSLKEYAE